MGIRNYSTGKTRETAAILKSLDVPTLIQHRTHSLLNRRNAEDLINALEEIGMGCIAVSRLAQSLLAEKYLSGFPDETGINQPGAGTLAADNLTGKNLRHVGALNDIAKARGQSLAQMATAWVLGDARVTTALVGASKPTQIVDWLEPCRT